MKIDPSGSVRNPGLGLFLVWLVAVHSFLSYFQAPIDLKLWVFVMGWLLPLVFFIRRNRSQTPEGAVEERMEIPSWFFWAIIPVALVVRCIWFGDFPNWLTYDEMINGYFAMKLDQHWDWHPYFFWTQLPPLLIWTLSLLFKVLPSPLTVIRALPILLSILMLPLAYGTLRNLFSRTSAFLYLAVLSTGFGLLFFGRICHQGLLLVLWEFATFYSVSRCLRAQASKDRTVWLSICGLMLGTGFYTYFSWPVVCLMASIPLLVRIWNGEEPRQRPRQILALGAPFSIALIPMVWSLFHRSFGTYYSFMLNLGNSESLGDYLGRIGRELSGFVWGYHIGHYNYGPVWGGFFNPVTGVLLVLGFLVLPGKLAKGTWAWVYGAAFVFFLPDLLSSPPLSEMRVIQELPLLSFVAVQGLEWVAGKFREREAKLLLVALYLVSSGLDLVHLQRSRETVNEYWDFLKVKENARAFPILERQYREQGPGILLTELNISVFHDYSLRVACFPFNAEDHPEWTGVQPRWAALVVNVNYQPFLAWAFPEGRWFWLSRDVDPSQNVFNGGLMLGILPVNDRTRERIDDWRKANGQLDRVLQQFVKLPIDPARKNSIRMMDALEPDLSRDPLVRSCYWDIQFSLHNWDNMFGRPSPENYRASFEAMRRAVREGFPAANFYNELGGFYMLERNYPQAEKMFKKAIHAPLDLTSAKDNLSVLMRLEAIKEGKGGASKPPG